MLNLYQLLPYWVRLRDNELKGPAVEGAIEQAFYAFQQEAETDESLIAGLLDLVNPDSVRATLLAFLARIVAGTGFVKGDWNDGRRRMVLKALVLLFRDKSTHPSWRALLQVNDEAAHDGWEMWKHQLREEDDYSSVENGGHRIKSARFRLVDSAAYTPVAWADELSGEAVVDPFRPIHVLPLRSLTEQVEADNASHPAETCLGVAGAAIADDAHIFGDTGTYVDEPCGSEGAEIVLTCVGFCETICQLSCTTACQTACQVGPCEMVGCMTFCQLNCQNACEWTCQTACEGVCETVCMTVCQTTCELACQTLCETNVEGP